MVQEIWDSLFHLWENPATANDARGGMLSANHLCSQAEWTDGMWQAADIRREALREAVNTAEKSFFNLKPKGQILNYLKIVQQSPAEPFLEFIDRLHRSVEPQIKDKRARQGVLIERQLLSMPTLNARQRY